VWLKDQHIDDESKHTMERISTSAMRMQELIEDLVNVTSLTKQQSEKEAVDLNLILKQVQNDLEEKIVEKTATINFEPLPVINGYHSQLRILLKALLDNALKFTHEDVPPLINISVQTVQVMGQLAKDQKLRAKKYYRIDITDNGIGFDNKFSHKLFQMFSALAQPALCL